MARAVVADSLEAFRASVQDRADVAPLREDAGHGRFLGHASPAFG